MPANTGKRNPPKHLTRPTEGETYVAFSIRPTAEVHAKLLAAAEKNKRSLNAEIMCRLEQGL